MTAFADNAVRLQVAELVPSLISSRQDGQAANVVPQCWNRLEALEESSTRASGPNDHIAEQKSSTGPSQEVSDRERVMDLGGLDSPRGLDKLGVHSLQQDDLLDIQVMCRGQARGEHQFEDFVWTRDELERRHAADCVAENDRQPVSAPR